MNATLHQFLMMAIMAAVIILLRAMPFILLCRIRNAPPLLLYLGKVMTAAAIAMLAVYSYISLAGFTDTRWPLLKLQLPPLAITVLLQYFVKNPLLSICGGTIAYMLLLHFFA